MKIKQERPTTLNNDDDDDDDDDHDDDDYVRSTMKCNEILRNEITTLTRAMSTDELGRTLKFINSSEKVQTGILTHIEMIEMNSSHIVQLHHR